VPIRPDDRDEVPIIADLVRLGHGAVGEVLAVASTVQALHHLGVMVVEEGGLAGVEDGYVGQVLAWS
jgi:hypothetical protein